jgi:hypothetical protein
MGFAARDARTQAILRNLIFAEGLLQELQISLHDGDILHDARLDICVGPGRGFILEYGQRVLMAADLISQIPGSQIWALRAEQRRVARG